MNKITLHPGDNRAALRRLIAEGVRVDSVVTDPPYGLVSIQKRFGKEGAAPARTEKNDGSFARLSGGFLGQAWDGTGIERDPEFWALIFDILKPGGCVFAFSGSRTGHWQACAMETAGFIMHPMHGWIYGTGFSKGHKINHPEWRGWAHGTQTQKPALEPIYLGQKPFSEKTGLANVLRHGVGAFNIDGCRVLTDDDLNGGAYAANPTPRTEMWGEDAGESWARGGAGEFVQPKGRYPANLLHDGSPEALTLFPDSKGQRGDLKGHSKTRQSPNGIFGEMSPALDHPARNDSGSAARFFNSFPMEEIPAAFYYRKAGKDDRAGSKHPTVKAIGLIQHLIRHITPKGGTVLDPFAGSGTTGEAALREGVNCILMEAHEPYVDFLETRFGLKTAVTDLSYLLGDDTHILNI